MYWSSGGNLAADPAVLQDVRQVVLRGQCRHHRGCPEAPGWCRPDETLTALRPTYGRGDLRLPSRGIRCLRRQSGDHLQQHVELQPLICSALLDSLDPVVRSLCIHIFGLSLE